MELEPGKKPVKQQLRVISLFKRFLKEPAVLACGGFVAVFFIAFFMIEPPANAPAPKLGQPIVIHRRSQNKPIELPFGGRTLADKRFVALYGTPGSPILGILGEQDVQAAIVRVKQTAAQYDGLSQQKVVPAMEIIATVASGEPTENGDYSREIEPSVLLPWIVEANKAGIYVILDLQPGRTDFLTQARVYEDLLKNPGVGLALDPEWRLSPAQEHLKQIGSVGVDEVNAVSTWLADLTKTNKLPQKIFLLHQFRIDMLPGRERLNTGRSELAYMIQMDGQGGPAGKRDTWAAITSAPPANVQFGWKNFIDEDKPMWSPAETMQVVPVPVYISYQ